MWTFILLYTLGLNICQAAGQENSTQMHYVKLTIDQSAINNIIGILSTPFVHDNNVAVEDLSFTTICKNDSTSKVECECERGYKWSDEVNQTDCSGDKCTFPKNLNHTCISNTTVTINGSITMQGKYYQSCLSANEANAKKCKDNVTQKIKRVYSTLRGFDSVVTCNYRTGSIIADFIITITAQFTAADLTSTMKKLGEELKDPDPVNASPASLVLETRGIVQLSMPSGPVRYESDANISCSTNEDLGDPLWELQTKHKNVITSGTESKVITKSQESTVTLNNTSERWAGEYTCTYTQGNIFHKASGVLDVSLLPNIDITTDPSFPRCKKKNELRPVTVKCQIQNSTETYTVTWNQTDIVSKIDPTIKSDPSKDIISYEANTFVGCGTPTPTLTCQFKNRLNQTRDAEIKINTINVGEAYCKADGDWEETKVNFTAVLKCKKAAGQKERKCRQKESTDEFGEWGPVESACVDLYLNDVLKNAIIAGTGLGHLNQNAARVFSDLQNVTKNANRINSFANMNASVEVLVSLSGKLNHIQNEATVNNVLESSSNLLEESLNNSWGIHHNNKPRQKDNGSSLTLAEKYITSMEQLIGVANLPTPTRKKNLEAEGKNCTQGPCSNTVFNVSVSVKSSIPDSVKTAGFKQLEKYLPVEHGLEPNSIVVSASKGNQTTDVEITIDFKLHKPRPPNTRIQCVYWNSTTRRWSEDGCKWEGPFEEGRCICEHLSSFAILMSKTPMTIPGLTEITYVGLSVSIVSLIISIVIEVIVWSALVKTNSLYLRHTAHINIAICLLVADCCFLASSTPEKIDEIWCKTSVVLKHFCYLSMFFWMLCLSSTLLHKAVFPFHNVSKRNYLRFSLVLGYVCPLLIVTITFLSNNAGAENSYFSRKTCWLIYKGFLKGSLHTFLIPIGIIVFVNVFSMLVVIMKLLDHPKDIQKTHEKENIAAKTVMRSVILLTPVFGVTWLFGFAVTFLDLTYGNTAFAVNYAFTLLNAFQGLFILLTTCLGEKTTRDALLNRLKNTTTGSTTGNSTKTDSAWKK